MRKLAAILAADVAGYSRLMQQDDEATLKALSACRRLFSDAAATRRGRIVNSTGDSILAEFASVVDAVECALEVQGALGEQNAPLPADRRMQLRIGVNLGDVLVDDAGALYGDGVNIAARLEALAPPGGICVSKAVRDQVKSRLPLDFEDLGERTVKNIAEPVRVFRLSPGAAGRASGAAGLADRPSIAVLPFDNLSGDAEQEYFADGIAEDLLTELSRYRWLMVIARNSSFSYKGRSRDVRQIGRELAVRYILEGSVRRDAQRIRVSAQLIDAGTGEHVWAERYDRHLADVFVLQDEITQTIAATIEPELARAESERARRKPSGDLGAWDLHQKGLWHLWQFEPEQIATALELFRQAISLDPSLARAHACLALGLVYQAFLGIVSHEDALVPAMESARQALRLDDRDAMAHYALGRALAMRGDEAAGFAELRTAISLNPSSSQARMGLAITLHLSGHFEESISEINFAIRLSPYDPLMFAFLVAKAVALIALGRHEEAESNARNAARHPRAHFWAFLAWASSLAHLGRLDEARSALGKVRDLRPDFSLALFERIFPHLHRGAKDNFWEGLGKAGLKPGGFD